MAFLKNTSAIEFGTATQTHSLTHIAVILNASTAVMMFSGALTTPRTLVSDDPITIPTNDLVVEFPAGTLENTFMVAMLTAMIGTGQGTGNATWNIHLGTGSLGTNPGSLTNEVSGGGYTAQTNQALAASAS